MRILLLGFSLVLMAASGEATAAFAQGYGGPTKLAQRSRASLDVAMRSRAQNPPSQPPGDAQVTPAEQAVNADELGVSIDRIRLRFRRGSFFNDAFDPSKLKLTAYVDVVAKAPEIKLFGADPRTVKEQLTSRAVPFGAPTHRDVVQMVTPPEFRTPPMDLTALINWLAQELRKKDEK
jgi:hypothetical protein